jgi:hypothetical protein
MRHSEISQLHGLIYWNYLAYPPIAGYYQM